MRPEDEEGDYHAAGEPKAQHSPTYDRSPPSRFVGSLAKGGPNDPGGRALSLHGAPFYGLGYYYTSTY